jgi:hypothetical protein
LVFFWSLFDFNPRIASSDVRSLCILTGCINLLGIKSVVT